MLCVGAAFLLVLIGATIYCQDRVCEQAAGGAAGPSGEGLPAPGRGAGHGGRGPFHYVQQEDGPWGKRYLLRSIPSYNFQELEDGTLFFFMMDSLEDPLVLSASVPLEVLYDGMEVRLE